MRGSRGAGSPVVRVLFWPPSLAVRLPHPPPRRPCLPPWGGMFWRYLAFGSSFWCASPTSWLGDDCDCGGRYPTSPTMAAEAMGALLSRARLRGASGRFSLNPPAPQCGAAMPLAATLLWEGGGPTAGRPAWKRFLPPQPPPSLSPHLPACGCVDGGRRPYPPAPPPFD